jgi:D-psicose/D-tagatose/L-ribulose 3-epimerase
MLGMSLVLWTIDAGEAQRSLLVMLKRSGFDLVEIPLFAADKEKCADLAKLLDEIGLARTGLTARGADDNPISPDPGVRRLAVENTCRAVDLAVELGARKLIGPFHSGFGVFSGHGPTRQEWTWAIDGVAEVAAHAHDRGVLLSVEFLNRFECYLLNTTADTARFIKDVGAENLGMVYDTHHAHIEDPDIRETILQHGSYINHVHVSESHRGIPGTGTVDWDATFRALRDCNYDGDYVVEGFGPNVPELIPLVKIWRKTYGSEEDLALAGRDLVLRHLRDEAVGAAA